MCSMIGLQLFRLKDLDNNFLQTIQGFKVINYHLEGDRLRCGKVTAKSLPCSVVLQASQDHIVLIAVT